MCRPTDSRVVSIESESSSSSLPVHHHRHRQRVRQFSDRPNKESSVVVVVAAVSVVQVVVTPKGLIPAAVASAYVPQEQQPLHLLSHSAACHRPELNWITASASFESPKQLHSYTPWWPSPPRDIRPADWSESSSTQSTTTRQAAEFGSCVFTAAALRRRLHLLSSLHSTPPLLVAM